MVLALSMLVGRRRIVRLAAATSVMAGASLVGGCVRQAAPAPFEARTTPPPWDAPRDAVSNIRQSGLAEIALNDTSDPHTFQLSLIVDGQQVVVPGYLGIDRVRAVQAPVHTHDDSGRVWLEGAGNREVTLGNFFTLWGVRATDTALGQVDPATWSVRTDGREVHQGLGLVLRTVQHELAVSVTAGRD